jgi:hypothetical protein
MTRTALSEETRQAANREARHRPPIWRSIWVRVSVLTALVLAGLFLTTMLLTGAGIGDSSGGDHGPAQEMEMDADGSGADHGSGQEMSPGSGEDHGSGGDHGSSERGSGADH